MIKKALSSLLSLVLIFTLAGCGKQGYLKKLGNSKVGVTWEGEQSYSWLVSQQLKKRTKLVVIDDQNLPQLADYRSPQALKGLKNQQNIDYILVVSVPYLGDVEQKSNFSVAQKGVSISVNYKRKVQLAYRVIAVPTGELLTSGITAGEGSHNIYARFDSQGASAKLTAADEEALLIDAIEDAIRRSELL